MNGKTRNDAALLIAVKACSGLNQQPVKIDFNFHSPCHSVPSIVMLDKTPRESSIQPNIHLTVTCPPPPTSPQSTFHLPINPHTAKTQIRLTRYAPIATTLVPTSASKLHLLAVHRWLGGSLHLIWGSRLLSFESGRHLSRWGCLRLGCWLLGAGFEHLWCGVLQCIIVVDQVVLIDRGHRRSADVELRNAGFVGCHCAC